MRRMIHVSGVAIPLLQQARVHVQTRIYSLTLAMNLV